MSATTAMTGLNYLYRAPILENDADGYATGAAIRMEGFSAVGDDSSTQSSGSVPADDNPDWLVANDLSRESETRDITLKQISLKDLSELTGAYYDPVNNTYAYDPRRQKVVGEQAISYASKQANGQYRMLKYYACTINSVKIVGQTTNSGNAQAFDVVINVTCSYPKVAGSWMEQKRDGALDLAWIEDFTDYDTPIVEPTGAAKASKPAQFQPPVGDKPKL